MVEEYRELADWADRDLLDPNGDKIGKVDELYYDETTGKPDWLLVRTGLFGTKKTFVPASEVRQQGEDLVVSFSKDRVKDAPRVEDKISVPRRRGAPVLLLRCDPSAARHQVAAPATGL